MTTGPPIIGAINSVERTLRRVLFTLEREPAPAELPLPSWRCRPQKAAHVRTWPL